MRLFQANIKPELIKKLIEFYENRVIPGLYKVKGCKSAKLIRSNHQQERFISMTLWETRLDSENYEKSDQLKEFIKEAEPFFSETSEWKVQLSEKQELTYGPVKEKPVITAHPIKTEKNLKGSNHLETDQMCMRIVASKVKKESTQEFHRIYEEEIIPELQSVDGCVYAYLAGSLESENIDHEDVFSVTIWENQEKAEAYAKSGNFEKLIKKLQHTFSQLSQWNLSLNDHEGNIVITSDDMTINRFSIITEKKFE